MSMITRFVCLSGLFFPASAFAGESESQSVSFQDSQRVFDSSYYDSGALPSGSPLAIRFFVASEGDSYAEVNGESVLTWDGDMEHGFQESDDGILEIEADLTAQAEVLVDLWGIQGSWAVWSETMNLADSVDIEGLLLPGGGSSHAVASDDGDGIFEYDFVIDIALGVGLGVTIDVFPEASTALVGKRIETGDMMISSASQTSSFELEQSVDELPLESTYVGFVQSDLDVVFAPALSLCHDWIGCFDVAQFDFPIELIDVMEDRSFEPVAYAHPLPMLSFDEASVDFGMVDSGTSQMKSFMLDNDGKLPLKGDVTVVGDGIEVLPSTFTVSAGSQQEFVITFSAEAEQTNEGVLVFETNDPMVPEFEVTVTGEGLEELVEEIGEESSALEEDGTTYTQVQSIESCGCSSTTGSSAYLSWLAALGGLALIRRRK